MKNCQWIALAALLFLSAMLGSCIPGQRLLTVQIESEGRVVYEGIHGVPDTTPVEDMWNVIGEVPFHSMAKQNDALGEAKKDVRELEGSIVVRIKHVDDELTRVALKGLTIHSSDSGASWSLEGDEVKRVKEAVAE